MPESKSQVSMMQRFLPGAVAGDEAALNALLRHCGERLTFLTRRMLGDYRRVRRWAETDDVLQNALLRLVAALRQVKPATSRDFLALATLQIRRELIDLARHFYGPEGLGARHDSRGNRESHEREPVDPPDARSEPSSLAQWTELHEQIGALPEEEREVVGLLFYQGMSQNEAAEVLNISVRTLQRRWHDALCKLHRVWNTLE
jgi:RNA polymerase sigma factor (sigma-70 family)